ncbi:hypothetical protein [Nocardia asteroides]|uniref:hypothetical protein n=1 Tax=Nocardia asteroides TaxID=1824 RepID=UPI001E56A041|nr:hypothetical protein [Nocardia asteroides]UGT65271.1 hypothetical protein LTT61_22910 [Nocardia asteroides]
MTFTVPSGATVAQLLELGSQSLLYFEHFGPRYQRWAKTVPENGDYATLHRRFYEQNGVSEERIRATADALRGVLGALREQYQAQGDSTRGIAGVWQGAAAAAEISLLNRQLAVAEVDIAALAEISAAFDRLPELLRDAVRGKAEIVPQILEHGTELKIDGKSPEDVDLIIDGADGFGWTHTLSAGSAASRAQALFPDLRLGVWEEFVYGGGAVQSPWSPYQDVIAERCRGWLDELFVPDYERKVGKFGELCTVVDDGVRRVYEGVAGKFAGLSGEGYPRAGDSASETPGAEASGTAPVSTEPVGTTPASTTPTSTTPTSTTPAAITSSATTPSAATPSATTPSATTPSATTATTPTPSSTTTPSTTTSPPSTTASPTTTQSPTTTTQSPTTSTPTTTSPSTTTSTPSTTAITTALEGLSTLNSAAQTLTPIAQSVAQSLGTGLSALTDSVTAGIDDALERVQQAFEPVDADGDGRPDDRVLAGFPLGEQQAEVALGADGQLALTLTEPDGSSAEYRLETDENGHPVLVQVDPETGEKIEPEGDEAAPGDDPRSRSAPDDAQAPDEAPQPADADPATPDPANPTPGASSPGDPGSATPAPGASTPGDPDPVTPAPGDPGSAPGDPDPATPAPGVPGTAAPVPGGDAQANPAPADPAPANNPGTGIPAAPRREEDGEHRSREFPDSAPAEPPDPDSGARLSEAGPL